MAIVGMEFRRSADFQVCCIADLEIGDTADLETCATCESARNLFYFLVRTPEDGIAQELDVSRVIVRVAVVSQREPDDASLGMFHDEHLRTILVLRRRMGRGQHLDGSALGVGLKPLQLILDGELGRDAAQQWMGRLGHDHFKLAQLIVPT